MDDRDSDELIPVDACRKGRFQEKLRLIIKQQGSRPETKSDEARLELIEQSKAVEDSAYRTGTSVDDGNGEGAGNSTDDGARQRAGQTGRESWLAFAGSSSGRDLLTTSKTGKGRNELA